MRFTRFEAEDDEGRREEFRQLLKSYMRFYSFVAQIIRLGDTGLETLYSYAAWLSRLLPNREIPADIEITEDMLRLQAFRVEQKEEGDGVARSGRHRDAHADQRVRRQTVHGRGRTFPLRDHQGVQ